MRRWIAVTWHASFFLLAAALYFVFVLPRWWELTGVWSPALGMAMRIVDGLLIGLTALPVVFTWLSTRKPEFGTPALALSLRLGSIVLHVLAGVLIVGTAVAEHWLNLDRAGQWLFGSYGAAAALAVLGALGFYLAFVAELPPPPPKPIKLKSTSTRRGRRKAKDQTDIAEASADEVEDEVEVDRSEAPAEAETEDSETEDSDAEVEQREPAQEADEVSSSKASDADSDSDDPVEGKLKNRRPGGKSTTRFRRRSGGVALDE